MITGESKAGHPAGRRHAWSPAPSRPTARCGCGSPRSARTRPWPGSSGWSPTPRPPRPVPRRWRTRPRRSCSTSPPSPASSPSRSGRCFGNVDEAVVRTVTVLVIACPHALGLAIPLVIAISTERAARSGVLVKDRLALERMRTVDVVLFDKTGTLTQGRHQVTGVAAHGDHRRSTCSRWRRRSKPTASTPSPGPSSPPPTTRVPAAERVAATDFRSLARPRGARARRRHRGDGRRPGDAQRSAVGGARRRHRGDSAVGGARGLGAARRRRGPACSGPWRSRTPCARNRVRRSTRCTPAG